MTRIPVHRFLKRMIAYAPGICLIHAVLWSVMNVTGLLPAWFVSRLLGQLSDGTGTADDVWFVIIIFTLIPLSQAVIWLTAGYTEITMRFIMSGLLRTNMLRLALSTPGSRLNGLSVGDAISRFRDDAYAGEDALDWTDEILIQSVFMLGAVAVLFSIDPLLTGVTILPMIAVTAAAQLVRNRLASFREASSEATSQVTGAIGDFVSAVPTLQSFGAEPRVLAHLRELGDRRRKTMLTDRIGGAAIDSVMVHLVLIGHGVIMLLAAHRIREDAMSIGEFLLFVMWFGFLTRYVNEFGLYASHYAQTGVAFQRMGRVSPDADPMAIVEHTPLGLRGSLPEAHSLPEPELPPLEHLDVVDATFTWPDSERGVSDVSFSVSRGSLTVITGRVGSGKSTLVNVLLGHLPLERGEIRWNSEPAKRRDEFFVPPRVASIGQIPRVFSDSLRSNITLGLPSTNDDLVEAIHLAVMEQDVAALDVGLETQVGARGVKLSGGQLQRTAAARAFIRKPDLLVMDDLSSALDVETEAALWQRMSEIPGLTAIAISHRRAALRRAHQVIVMAHGRVMASGSLAEVLAISEEMRALWNLDEDERGE